MRRFKFIRATIWAICTMIAAYLLGVDFTWRVVLLCVAATLIDSVVYADYSETSRAWKEAASHRGVHK